MLEGHPALSQLHIGRAALARASGRSTRLALEKALLRSAARARYDLIVHLSEQPRGAWLARALGARYSVAPTIAGRGRFWANELHASLSAGRGDGATRSSSTSTRCGASACSRRCDERKVTFVPGAAGRAARRQAARRRARSSTCIRLRAGASSAGRAERNAELIDRLAADGHRVVLTAAPDESGVHRRDPRQGEGASRSTSPASSRSRSSAR